MSKKCNNIGILGVTSSPHRNGNSTTLAREFLKQAEFKGVKVEEIYLPDHNLKFCRGCMTCLRTSGCPMNDDLNFIRDKILESDGVVFSTPSYGLAPNAMMMNFLQRFGLWAVYRSALGSKYIASIASVGGIGGKRAAKYILAGMDGLFIKTRKVGMVISKEGTLEKSKVKVRKLAKKMVNDIARNKKYRFQSLLMKLIIKLFIARLMKNNLNTNKEESMKGVYQYVVENGIIKET